MKRGVVAANTKYSLAGKGQVAMEYVMILTFVLMILIPTVYVFREYVVQSSDDIVVNNIDRIAKTIIDTSRDMFYLGDPSKIIIDLEMPEKIEAIWLMDNSDDENAVVYEYFLMFKLNLKDGPQDFYYASDFPIKCLECKTNVLNDPVDLSQQCGTNNFKCYRFLEPHYSPGIKHFKIEADICAGIGLCVIIGEVSTI